MDQTHSNKNDDMAQRAPLIVVLGATACGKSRLAIELARRFNGEIISADSMQVYKGLDIVTNKVTAAEQQLAKHHMIDFLDPLSRYSVIDFRNKSLEVIGNLHDNKRIPIVVGGTNYYIESLLWKAFILGPTLQSAKKEFHEPKQVEQDRTLIDSEFKLLKSLSEDTLHHQEDFEDVDKFFAKPIYNDAFAQVDSQKLWNILEKVDPNAAHLYHPKDKRRLIRSLQIIQENKKNYTEVLEHVNKSGEGDKSSLGGPLRFKSTLVIWLNCDHEILDKVMDERVDKMLDRGLLAELEDFHENYNKQRLTDGKKPEYDKGVFQTIGFKEFHDYLMLDTTTKESDEGNKILKRSIQRMKISTRQYAKRQLKWIRRRFLQSGTRDLPSVFKLETSFDEQGWLAQVQEPAYKIVSCFLEGRDYPGELLEFKKEPEKQEAVNNPGKHYCEICDRTFIGSFNIESHIMSKRHRKTAEKLSRKKRQRTDDDLEAEASETATKLSPPNVDIQIPREELNMEQEANDCTNKAHN
uniref:tRNA dimethylallyltransferase, mitochondrial n=1 Tax=Aceria tosichella TaxID=561515 RepID=A0A6G1SBQ9_9ACAR